MREYRVRAKNGAILHEGMLPDRLREAGNVELATGIAMDITEEKQQEILYPACERKTGKISSSRRPRRIRDLATQGEKEIIDLFRSRPSPRPLHTLRGSQSS